MDHESRSALVMSGGGAHAAYQVGVLRAITRLLPRHAARPFSVYCGTSAGAINGTVLAAHADDLREGVERLTRVWGRFTVEQVFAVDWKTLANTASRWLSGLVLGRLGRSPPLALLDRGPLEDLLATHLPFADIAHHIQGGHLHAVSITASSYGTGQSVTFYEGAPGQRPWQRADRIGRAVRLSIAHLLASSAIPFVFEPVTIDGDYYGDGAMRQTAPLSAALHLGARRLFVIGAQSPVAQGPRPYGQPSLARIAAHVLNSLFLEGLDADLERLERVNQTVRALARRGLPAPAGLSEISCFTIYPSEDLASIASAYYATLPRALRFFLGALAPHGRADAALASYLLFEQGYCRHLMALGYADAIRKAGPIRAFLGYPAQGTAGGFETGPGRGVPS